MNDITPTIEFDTIKGLYTQVFVPSKNINVLPIFKIGNMTISTSKVGNNWVLTFVDENNLVQTLATINNSYLSYTNMDIYFFSSDNINAFSYILMYNNPTSGHKSYLFDYRGNLMAGPFNSYYVTSWSLEPDDNLVTYYTTRETNTGKGYAFTTMFNNVTVDARLISLTNAVSSVSPINKGIDTLQTANQGSFAVVLNNIVTSNSLIFVNSRQDGGVPGFLRVTNINPGVSFTVTSGSSLDTSTFSWFFV